MIRILFSSFTARFPTSFFFAVRLSLTIRGSTRKPFQFFDRLSLVKKPRDASRRRHAYFSTDKRVSGAWMLVFAIHEKVFQRTQGMGKLNRYL